MVLKRLSYHRPLGLLLVLATTGTCCIEPFYLLLEREAQNVVVEGLLLDDQRFQLVKVSQLQSTGRQVPVTDAGVRIEAESGAVYLLSADEEGIYRYPEEIPVETSGQFRLLIDLADETQLLSAWETVPEKVFLAAGEWEKTNTLIYNHNGIPITTSGFNFLVSTAPIPGDDVYLRWQYESTHINEAPYAAGLCLCRNCYVTAIPRNFVNVERVTGSAGKSLSSHIVAFERLDKRFSFRFTMLIRQISTTESAGRFYEQIDQQMKIRGNIFDPPPAIINGNVSVAPGSDAKVYGLFELGRLDEIAISVFAGDIEEDIITYFSTCEVKRFNNNFDPACFNCFSEPGAVSERPYYY